jgi:hypothetical protein
VLFVSTRWFFAVASFFAGREDGLRNSRFEHVYLRSSLNYRSVSDHPKSNYALGRFLPWFGLQPSAFDQSPSPSLSCAFE